MTTVGRIRNILRGIFTILGAILIMWDPQIGLYLVAGIISVSLLFFAVRILVYYFTMARHMVSGKAILFSGMLLLDVGLFIISLENVEVIFVMLYLIGLYAIQGVVHILRGLEEKRALSSSWSWTFTRGVFDCAIALGCLFSIKDIRMAVYVYSFGMLISGITRIINSFRHTEVAYIQ